jgi:hypothetical protein
MTVPLIPLPLDFVEQNQRITFTEDYNSKNKGRTSVKRKE